MIYDLDIKDSDLKMYTDSCVNKMFAILGIFEDCQEKNDFTDFHTYITRIITEFSGIYKIFDIKIFLSLLGLLEGMNQKENIQHKEVKSIVFHCISIIKKGIDR